MRGFRKGRYSARRACDPGDLVAAQALRHLAFFGVPGRDADCLDEICEHVLVEDQCSGALVCCFRMLPIRHGRDIGQSYSARYYGLSALEAYGAPMAEIGRFCMRPGCHDADVLRTAWAAITRFVEDEGIEMLFGCSSFCGTRAEAHRDAFALMRTQHLGPERWLPKVKAPHVIRYGRHLGQVRDFKRGLLAMPPLLRTYLKMGGWVSDHAVVDCDLNTLHVFTGLEIKAIPPARARLLRAAAA